MEHGIDNSSGTPKLEMGGQAVIEGVLMRSRTGYAVAVRNAKKNVVIRQVPYQLISNRYPPLKLPIIRGAAALFEMLAIGTRSLRWSAEEFENTQKLKKGEKIQERSAEPLPQSAMEAYKNAGFLATISLSMAIVVVMMIIAPNFLALMTGKLPFLRDWAEAQGTLGFSDENHPLAFNLLSGLYRGVIITLYVWVISLIPDIKRVFEYHGAEHKAVLALESGKDVTIENAQKHDTLHPRCGTTFLFIVLLVSILVFSVLGWGLLMVIPGFADMHTVLRHIIATVANMLALPLVAGIALEIVKFCAKRMSNPICRLILWPGFLFQRLTTRQPDDSEVEVAIIALLAALAIPPDQKEPKEYVVRGLHDEEDSDDLKSSNPVRKASSL